MANVVGVRFRRAGKVYYFDSAGFEIKIGEHVIVETARGLEIGRVVIAPRQVLANEITEPLKPVVRLASPEDVKHGEELDAKAEEALIECGKMINELQLPMKLLTAEYNLDGNRLTFMFSAEDRVDFRELLRRLIRQFRVRIELRQVGARDEAKLIGGFGRCGRHLCCASFIDEFQPVTIKMAKEQDLPLNPMKISGSCGRLMCCLSYENEQYRDLKDQMPRLGQYVTTHMGEAKVVGVNALKGTVLVEPKDAEAAVELPLKDITFQRIDKANSSAPNHND
ncbi:MAG: stage 0 sporulation family protein [Chloroflexota bacterium]